MAAPFIGIDFGNTFSCASWWDGRTAQIISPAKQTPRSCQSWTAVSAFTTHLMASFSGMDSFSPMKDKRGIKVP